MFSSVTRSEASRGCSPPSCTAGQQLSRSAAHRWLSPCAKHLIRGPGLLRLGQQQHTRTIRQPVIPALATLAHVRGFCRWCIVFPLLDAGGVQRSFAVEAPVTNLSEPPHDHRCRKSLLLPVRRHRELANGALHGWRRAWLGRSHGFQRPELRVMELFEGSLEFIQAMYRINLQVSTSACQQVSRSAGQQVRSAGLRPIL